ncbi:MAG: phage baseplate protein [Terriglobia bacterium]
MRASQLLNIWEHAAPQPPVERALTLLAATRPETGREELAALSIGERDARLLELREAIFGNRLEVFAACPECDERLEFSVLSADLWAALPAPEDQPARKNPPELIGEDFYVRFRLPNSYDLAAASVAEDSARARGILIERCVLEASREGHAVRVGDLPGGALERLAAEISTRDPGAELTLNVSCPACGHSWALPFDIASFLWEEFTAQARRLLREVATLAINFGWHEREVLDMSPARRQIYLELAR